MVDLYAPLYTPVPVYGYYTGGGSDGSELASRFTLYYLNSSGVITAVPSNTIGASDYLEVYSLNSANYTATGVFVAYDGSSQTFASGQTFAIFGHTTGTFTWTINFPLGRRLETGTHPKVQYIIGTGASVVKVSLQGLWYQARS